MAVQSKQPDNSLEKSKQTYPSGTLKLKKFDFKNLNLTNTIVTIAKKPSGMSWIAKDILYHNDLVNTNNMEEEIDKLSNLINTKLHM